jgi:tripartite-type tricarboxylate transporter receptor subunit TctC
MAAGAAALPAVSRIASAQTYPSRPITMVVTYPAGSAMDTEGRILAERMRLSLGQPVIIENISGANGGIGVGRVARAAGNGYTLVIGNWSTNVANGAVYQLTYDLLADFEPISLLLNGSYLIVARKTMPANDLRGFIAWLKANPTWRRKGRQESEAHSTSADYCSKNSLAPAFSSYLIEAPARRCRIWWRAVSIG